MADTYYDFMMRQPGIASSLVSGVAATRDAQNKERLRQAAAAMKKRLADEVQRSQELSRVEALSTQLTPNANKTALGEAAAASAAAENARYDGASLATPIAPGAKRKELSPEEFDAKVKGAYFANPDDLGVVEQNRGAFVDPETGKAYSSHEAYRADKTEQNKAEARRRATSLKVEDAQKIRDAHTIRVKDLQALKAKAPAEFAKLGFEEKDITPEMLDQAAAKFDDLIAQEKAAYEEEVSRLTQGGAKKLAKKDLPKLQAMKEKVDALMAMGHRVSGAGATYKQAQGSFEKSIDADARQFLQEMLVNNPIADRPDPRDEDRLREKALESRLPEIMQLQSVDPEGTKTLLEQLKQESRQGDAGLEAERKAMDARLRSNTQLLTSYEQGARNFVSQSEQVKQAWERLRQSQQKLDDAKGVNARKLAQKDRDLDIEEYTKLLEEMGRNARNQASNASGDYRASANAAFVPAVRQMYELRQRAATDPSIPKNFDEALRLFQKGGLKFSKRAEPTIVGERPSEGFMDKGGMQAESVAPTVALPPLEDGAGQSAPGPGKGGAAKPRDLKLRVPKPPSGWTQPKKLPDGSWIAKNPKTNKFERY